MIDALRQPESEYVDRLSYRMRSWVIVIATTLMGVAVLFTLIDAYLDRTL